MRLRPALLALACALGVLLCAAQSSSAATYSVWSCSNFASPYAKLAFSSWFSPAYGAAFNFCPDGLQLGSGEWIAQAGPMEWQWIEGPSGSQFTKITFTIKGGDSAGGLKYELATTNHGEAFAELPERAPGDPETTLTYDIPPGAQGLVFRAACPEWACTGTEPLMINEIKFRLVDSEAPVLSLSSDEPLGESKTDPVPWFKPISMPLQAGAGDSGSGLRSATLRVDTDNDPVWQADTRCDDIWERWDANPPTQVVDKAAVCDHDAYAPENLELVDRSEGRHKLTLEATDAFGLNAEPLVGWFGVDDTPPAAPTGVNAASEGLNDRGWTQSPIYQFSVAWYPTVGPNVAPLSGPFASITREGAPATRSETSGYGEQRVFPSEGEFDLEGWYVDAAGNRGYSKHTTIGYDTTAPPPPLLNTTGWISGDSLRNGVDLTWQHMVAPDDVESDICGFIAEFNREPAHAVSGEPNVIGNVDGTRIPANLRSGTNFAHVASVSCADVVSPTSTTVLKIDDQDPEIRVRGLDGSPWSRTEKTVTLDPVDGLSGVHEMRWKLDNDPEESSAGPVSLLLTDGEHTIRTWAVDNAGNVSEVSTIIVRVDASGPIGWLAAPDPAEPSRFVAHVEDATSGAESAVMQFRRIDDGASEAERQWRQIGAAHLVSGDATAPQVFARTLDDSLLADGRYELRVVATDRAGNTGVGSTLPAGGQVLVDIPLRVRPTLSVVVADMERRCASGPCATKTKCKASSRCTFRWVATDRGAGIDRIVNWGDRQALTGRLLTPAGAPIAAMPITVYSTPRGGNRELAVNLTTDDQGRFAWRIPNGPSRSFEIVSGANNTYASASTSATEAVRAGVTLRFSDRSVRSGQTVRLSGRLLSGSLGVPAEGKAIQFQIWRDGKWKNAIDSTNTDSAGRFRYDWPLGRFRSRGTLFVRAVAESRATETSWPFEAGKSVPVRVSVRP